MVQKCSRAGRRRELTQGREGTIGIPGFVSLHSGSRKPTRVPELGLKRTEISLLRLMLLVTSTALSQVVMTAFSV